jgi:hypothetical protein
MQPGDVASLRRLFALQPSRSRTLLRPDSSDPIRQVVCKVKSWLSQPSLAPHKASQLPALSLPRRKAGSDFDGVSALGGDVLHGGGAIEFVPGEGAALDGALQRAEQDEGKDLAIGEALQPYLA